MPRQEEREQRRQERIAREMELKVVLDGLKEALDVSEEAFGPSEGPSEAVAELVSFFRSAHLPPHLSEISEAFADLAEHMMDAGLTEGREVEAGFRKLVEAKDCLVRARLLKRQADAMRLAGDD